MATKQMQELMFFFFVLKKFTRTANEPALKMRSHWFIAVKKKCVHSSYLQRGGGGGGGCKEKPQIHYIQLVVKEPMFFTTKSLSLSLSLSLIRSHIISPPNPSWAKNTKHHNKVHRLVVT
jgi:hypothetical protein